MRAGGRSRRELGVPVCKALDLGALIAVGRRGSSLSGQPWDAAVGHRLGLPELALRQGGGRCHRPVSSGASRWGAHAVRHLSCPHSWAPRLISVRGPAFVPGHMMAGGVPHGRYVRGRSFYSGRPATAGGSYRQEQAAQIIRTGAPTGRAWAHAAWNASSPSSLKMWWAWRASLRATDNVARLAPSRAATSL